ncbi:MAG: class I SAM-dependent methyltransferase [Cyanobacteria bacterium]|nr:class I SAM-dependent methyltransferase [Cyanobacteriota bacterium]MDA0886081.1 class I SAM-dependent methyltransferase [Cyanobacteriota bacterium]
MTESHSKWQTKELADTFLEGIRGAIPGADLQLEVISKITDQWCDAPNRILDLGCGNGILGCFLLSRFPSASGLLLDFSDPMLDAARRSTESLPQATVDKADFGSPDWTEIAKRDGPYDLVVSGFAIHHQPDERKRELYGEIFNLLTPGGVFLNLEHVASATEAGEEIFDDYFVDHLHEFHTKTDPDANRDAIAQEYYKRPDKQENILASVEAQCEWLRESGFTDVDCFFKVFELALFGGRKSSNNGIQPTK